MHYAPLRLALVASLLIAPAPVFAQNFSAGYKFLDAVRGAKGNEIVEILNQPGTTVVNTRDRVTGDGALHIVTKRSDSLYLRFLLQKNANPNLQDKDGNTPMMLAVENSFGEGVDTLALYKADVNLANSSGETPLIRAVQRRNLDMVRRLLKLGANPDQKDIIAGRSAREYARLDTRSPAIQKLIDAEPVQDTKRPRVISGPVL
ncbi:ankyrin repeat domain-containing protein [Sphingomonas japonica]|uniref:Ankyrin repeat protein n=1 Tax=Sphingomonas japonica TaxID=511662 RepID=A0ABX0U053_9SPHN|nr:ankyrin repeat domain-containing protein [Sphingomonas japonica]NIJ23954.1 ankyrin repeat protein [Sphingomonas japonica]